MTIHIQSTTLHSDKYPTADHSPILLACPEAVIYSFDRSPIEQIAYEYTEHFQIYKSFLEDRGSYL